MKKRTIAKLIGEEKSIDLDYQQGDIPTPIDEVIEFLTSGKEDGATHVHITGFTGCNLVEIQPVALHEESEEAFAARELEKEKSRKPSELEVVVSRIMGNFQRSLDSKD